MMTTENGDGGIGHELVHRTENVDTDIVIAHSRATGGEMAIETATGTGTGHAAANTGGAKTAPSLEASAKSTGSHHSHAL